VNVTCLEIACGSGLQPRKALFLRFKRAQVGGAASTGIGTAVDRFGNTWKDRIRRIGQDRFKAATKGGRRDSLVAPASVLLTQRINTQAA